MKIEKLKNLEANNFDKHILEMIFFYTIEERMRHFVWGTNWAIWAVGTVLNDNYKIFNGLQTRWSRRWWQGRSTKIHVSSSHSFKMPTRHIRFIFSCLRLFRISLLSNKNGECEDVWNKKQKIKNKKFVRTILFTFRCHFKRFSKSNYIH